MDFFFLQVKVPCKTDICNHCPLNSLCYFKTSQSLKIGVDFEVLPSRSFFKVSSLEVWLGLAACNWVRKCKKRVDFGNWKWNWLVEEAFQRHNHLAWACMCPSGLYGVLSVWKKLSLVMRSCGPTPCKPIPKAKSRFSLSSPLGPSTTGPHSGLVKPLSFPIQWALGLHGELWEQKGKWINGIFLDPLPPFPVE